MSLEEAKELAFELMSDYGLYYWKFKFDFAKCRFGCCYEYTKTISLSKPLVLINDSKVVKNVILHEIAHALVGNKHGHNSVWRQKAIEIECEFTSRYAPDIKTLPRNVIANCPSCGHLFRRFRNPKKNRYCGKCCDVPYEERLLRFERIDIISLKKMA